jgi:hypothetical protein
MEDLPRGGECVKREWRGEEDLVTVAVVVEEEAGRHLLVVAAARGSGG